MSLAISDINVRCWGLLPDGRKCNKLLAEKVTRPWTIRCPRCKAENHTPNPGTTRTVVLEPRKT